MPGVADEADAAGERDGLAGEPVRVAAAVPALVLGAHGGARCESEPIAPTMCAPIAGCSRMTSHSGAVSRPGFCRIASGTPTLPMSCSSATWPTEVDSSAPSPSSRGDLERELEHRLGVRSGVVLARVERREQRLPGGRLDLVAAPQQGALGGVEPVARDPRENVEVAQVALAQVGLRRAAEAAERAVERAVAAAHRNADVRADPGRRDERVACRPAAAPPCRARAAARSPATIGWHQEYSRGSRNPGPTPPKAAMSPSISRSTSATRCGSAR